MLIFSLVGGINGQCILAVETLAPSCNSIHFTYKPSRRCPQHAETRVIWFGLVGVLDQPWFNFITACLCPLSLSLFQSSLPSFDCHPSLSVIYLLLTSSSSLLSRICLPRASISGWLALLTWLKVIVKRHAFNILCKFTLATLMFTIDIIERKNDSIESWYQNR